MAEIKDKPEGLKSTNALDDLPAQGALIEAAVVKFTGNGGALDDPPNLEEQRTYIVKATCVGHDHRLRKDGEERVTAIMEIDACWEKGKQPDVDQNQGSLFPTGDADDGDDEDGSDE